MVFDVVRDLDFMKLLNELAHNNIMFFTLVFSCVCIQLGPWLAVEIPDLIDKGLISHKDKTNEDN